MKRASRLVCVAGGLAFAGSIPPLDAPPLAYAGLALLAFGLDAQCTSPPVRPLREGALRGWLFGLALNLLGLRFVPTVVARFTPLPWVGGLLALALLASAQGLTWGVAGLGRAALVRLGVASPLAFALAIYAAAQVPAVFPFTAAGPLSAWPALMQLADLIGERGVACVVAGGAALVVEALRAFRRKNSHAAAASALALAIPGALLTYGHLRLRAIEAHRDSAPHARIAALGPGIGASERWSAEAAPTLLQRSQTLTRAAEMHGAELTVWTESAYPYVLDPAWRRAPIGAWNPLGRGVHGPVLLGAVLHSPGGDSYNAALVADLDADGDGRLSAPYEKLHLLWFGETVPLADQLPWLRHTFLRGTGLSPGAGPVALLAGPARAGVLICFEDTLPEAGREAARVGPNVLVNLTNDAWFAGSAESALHLRLGSWRAVETRRDVVRAVNLGPVSWVDAAGRVRGREDGAQPVFLLAEPALLDDPPTAYARFGDGPGLVAAAALVAYAYVRQRRRIKT